MADKKIIAVIGSTGTQGGGLCRAILADPAGGFKLTGITLTVVGEVDGMDETAFVAAAEEAKAGCPISKALTGVDITLKASLA